MTRIRVLLVDDEAPARAKLRRLLATERDVEIVGEAFSGAEALAAVETVHPDVIFLDIQMPGNDGFEVVSRLDPATMPHIVFVTAHAEHAIRAFEVHAADYLLKPVTPKRLAATVARIREVVGLGAPTAAIVARLKDLAATLSPRPQHLSRLLVHDATKAFFIPAGRIDWIDSASNYVQIHVGRDSFRERGTLAALAERLDPGKFLRISRSQIVRLEAIRELNPWSHGDYQVVLHDGTRLMWSRRYRARAAGEFHV